MDPEKRANEGGPDDYLRGQRRIALLFAVRSRALAAQDKRRVYGVDRAVVVDVSVLRAGHGTE